MKSAAVRPQVRFRPFKSLSGGYLANDDAHLLEARLDELEVKGQCVNLNDRIHREDGFVFCGMNKVRDYPLGCQHWCAPTAI